MARSEPAGVHVRPGGVRVEIENEGLCVYLYDAANRHALCRDDAWSLANDGLSEKPPKDPRLEALAASHQLVVYELQQDDPVCVEVLVGPPPTAKELKLAKGLKWMKPQTSRLSLPSGELWIDSPNSCRINPKEPPQADGGEVRVPPGDYQVTLHRVDWDESNDSLSGEYDGPDEVITLTPATGKAKASLPWALLFPIERPDLSWVGQYTIAGNIFKGLINFWDYWEFLWVNLDRAAFDKMGLQAGSVLELEVTKPRFRCVLVFLGDLIEPTISHLNLYKALIGHDAMTASLAGEPEVAYARFKGSDPVGPTVPETLIGLRVRASAAVDKKLVEKWSPVTLTLRPERLLLPTQADFGQWKKIGDGVEGKVLLNAPRYLTMSFDAAALATIGVRPGDTFVLHAGDQQYRVDLFAGAGEWAATATKLTGGFGNQPAAWTKLQKDFYGADGPAAEDAVRARMRTYLLGKHPLAAHFDQHWLLRDQPILLIQPTPADREHLKLQFGHGIDAAVGSTVRLTKA